MQRVYKEKTARKRNPGSPVIAAAKFQLLSIATGGLPVLAKKLGLIALVPPSLVLILVVRLLRPLILIRFGPLVSFRIGHFSSNTEIHNRTFHLLFRNLQYQIKRNLPQY